MTQLSVNLNKVALLRNARTSGTPSVRRAGEICLDAGAGGLTVHPRPDGRHTRPEDVIELSELIRTRTNAELNVEGNPFPEFLELVLEVQPTQCTLVPDEPDASTSDHGWDLSVDGDRLRTIIRRLQDSGIRVSLFLEPNPLQIERAKELGADRIELYTEPYARAWGTEEEPEVLDLYSSAARAAQSVGLGVNAGHDLNLDNLAQLCGAVDALLEVSIGHALIAHSLEVGLGQAVQEYLAILSTARRGGAKAP